MNSITRRHFLHGAALGAAALTQAPAVLRGAEPDRKLKLA
jgi:flagella basal body P-ring formation protein FlgA